MSVFTRSRPDHAGVGGETWLSEGLGVAQRILAQQTAEALELSVAVQALAASVAWESPAAREFRRTARRIEDRALRASRELEVLHIEAVRLRGEALLQAGPW